MVLGRATVHWEALDKSLEVRDEAGLDFKAPLNVYDLCDELNITVRFVNDISMEGWYIGTGFKSPTILLSTLRPPARRAFTCAHELGHHVFGDGSTIDELRIGEKFGRKDLKESRADGFAGHLLMPSLGIAQAFGDRGWNPPVAAPDQVYTVACSFGVGYTTLVNHMVYSLHLITERRGQELLKTDLPQIRETLLGSPSSGPLIVADRQYGMPTLDIEVGTLLLVPPRVVADTPCLESAGDLGIGRLFRASRPGICRTYIPESPWAVMVRISRQQYGGLAKYRHLEEVLDD